MNPQGRSMVDEERNLGRPKTRSSLVSGSQMNHLPARLPKNPQIEESESQLRRKSRKTEFKDDEFWPLSGKPYCHVILTKSHVQPIFHMVFPVKFCSALPDEIVPVFVTFGNKRWDTTLYGNTRQKRFDASWKNFVIDNSLKVGDALVFELLESSSKLLRFRVQILRGDFPPELLARVNAENSKAPIALD